jgi:hypothetical protein
MESHGICQNTAVQFPPPTTPPTGTQPCVAFAQACSSAAECCPTQVGTPVSCSGGLCRFNQIGAASVFAENGYLSV